MAQGAEQSRLKRALRLRPREWLDLVPAMAELARARLRLKQIDVQQFRPDASPAADQHGAGTKTDLIRRISLAIPRAASLVPWRADCLVRAEAARHWLSRHQISSEIRLGARPRPENAARKGLDAHAWLVCNGQVITGGDISGFTRFTSHTRPTNKGQDRTLS